LLTSLDKDTCVDGGEFEAGEVLDTQSDREGDDSDVESDEKAHEPDDQSDTPRRLSYTQKNRQLLTTSHHD